MAMLSATLSLNDTCIAQILHSAFYRPLRYTEVPGYF